MNWRHEFGNLIREVVSHGVYDTLFGRKERRQQNLNAEKMVRGDPIAHLRSFFAWLKRGARKSDDTLGNSLLDTANRMTTRAEDAKHKRGYK